MNNHFIQNRDGLPASILEERRFFELYGAGKDCTPKGWNNPEGWKYLEDIPEEKNFGFAIGNQSNYLFIDADHVIHDGKMIQWVLDVYKRITQISRTYSESSISGTGWHMVCDLGDLADDFPRTSNGYTEIIIDMNPEEYHALSDEERDKTPKIEMFYHTAGRYVCLTGKNKEVIEVARDEDAAAIFRELLMIREEFHQKHKWNGSEAAGSGKIGRGRYQIDDDTKNRILEALPFIPATARETWVTVGIALSNCGFPFELWDEWSQYDDMRSGRKCGKYNADETPKIWKSFEHTASCYGAGTVFRVAKEYGWHAKRKNGISQNNGQATKDSNSLKPKYFTDLGEAAVYIQEYGGKVRFSKATDFLVYNGKLWRENELDAQMLAQKLTIRQLKEARGILREKQDALIAVREAAAGAVVDVLNANKDAVKSAEKAVEAAEYYHDWILKRQSSNNIAHTLKEAKPSLQIEVEKLDADGLLLNTPAGTVDLKSGQMLQHNAADYCTKITSVAPSGQNAELYFDFIKRVTCGDEQLAEYLQQVAGMCAVGKVFSEKLIIAYGGGGNGKSTLFNLWAEVLGDYAGTIPSEALIVRAGNAKEYSIANLRGKRLIIAAELREGARLSTDAVKKMCSTDKVTAEKKFKDPFEFKPSHSIVLYTNILPKVGTNDSGTWDRLVVIPFRARFRNADGEVKNYAEYLFEKCGGVVLQWIIEGAVKFIANGGDIVLPECVKAEIESYKDQNDWLSDFISECCMTGKGYSTGSGELYKVYGQYCDSTGEYRRSKADFKTALVQAGYIWHKDKAGAKYYGITTKSREYIAHYGAS